MESKKKDSALVRSSAAEYLTFVASTGEDKDSMQMFEYCETSFDKEKR